MDGRAVTGHSSERDFERAGVGEAAGDWLALLHSDDRTPELEAQFRAWLEADPEHAEAFDAITRTWELIGPAGKALRRAETLRKVFARSLAVACVVAVAVTIMIVGGFGLAPARTLETKRGEQRTVVLNDGSRVALNTDTKVIVRYQPHHRLVRLEHGEAAFDVAHDRSRPFVVTAAGEEVTAVGTSFTVRLLKADDLSVTLTEGRLKLAPVVALGVPGAKVAHITMQAGQRWTPRQGVARLDPALVDASSAWRRGELVFKDTPLPEAIAEMNRYGHSPILLQVSRAEDFRISGIFRFDDSLMFARALAGMYGLDVEPGRDAIRILGEPQPQNNSSAEVQIRGAASSP